MTSKNPVPAAAVNTAELAVHNNIRAVAKSLLAPEGLPEDTVEVGRILGAWGVKGWVKLQSFSSDAEALFAAKQWFLVPSERGNRLIDGALQVAVSQIKVHADVLVAQLAGVTDRDVAAALKGAGLFVRRNAFPQLDEEDEFYWVDLIGLTVVNREGIQLGVVRELLSNGPQSVLVVDAPAELNAQDTPSIPAQALIPFVDAYIDRVSLAEKRIDVDWQSDY